MTAPTRSLRPVARTLIVSVVALVAASCGGTGEGDAGSDASSTTTTDAAAVESQDLEVQPEGHEEAEGHDLALGDDTPKDPKGRHFLHHGDTGADVVTLQQRLLELGAPIGTADDVFGDKTLQAVMAFQRSEGLTPDGVVGTATWAALDAPAKQISWSLPEVPTEHATEEPTTVPGAGAPSGTAPKGDGAAAGAATAPHNDPAAGGGAWAKAVVSLSSQTATFYDAAGAVVLQAPISSGKNGLTPQGTFHVQSKSARAFSGNGVYMNDMVRFNGGIGFHSIPKKSSGQDLPTPARPGACEPRVHPHGRRPGATGLRPPPGRGARRDPPLTPTMADPANPTETELIEMTEQVAPDLLRYGWASAAIDAQPDLMVQWADHPDTAIRRAVMRSTHLSAEVAELVVATRRSGLHTLGSNPLTPIELIDGRPGALRRRRAIEHAGADDLDRVMTDPNHESFLELGSPTIDLVLARSVHLDERIAADLAARAAPRVDPWVAALLWVRFGDTVRDTLRREQSDERNRAVRRLLDEWTVSDMARRTAANPLG